ncbi:EamA family transporter [Nocardioides marmoribigeumensis]|uniref:Inner membrane transporter RhtA n=1 Tax=Nocardioides marmoribigeumensis TaxID=433649 RepID=A0ABU2BS35_9ACTN|nr:EamA family transporter [Nocardioides marmoribigeumensis]MDR7361462.1 inner membrane transporter RhtA [Nocardioides marmoribigeumensis]
MTSASAERRAVVLVVAGVLSVQLGGAFAATLLPEVGVLGSVALRMWFAATLLLAIARPRLTGRTRQEWGTAVAFGLALLAMNTAFYGSLDRLPIGVAVTIEFTGPLLLAALSSRHVRDVAAVGLAVAGVVLICEVLRVSPADLDLVGIGLAATAGACWAAYILLSGRAGAHFEGLDGIALSMGVAAVLAAPYFLAAPASGLQDPGVLGLALGVAVLSSALPYSLELVALRSLAAGVFGVLLSLEPAAAALMGLWVLGQTLHLSQLAGMAAVVAAGVLVLGRGSVAPIGTDPDVSGTMTR